MLKRLLRSSCKDHCLAMTWSLVESCGNTPVNIVDFDSVKVSFPQLLESFERLAEVGGTKRVESCFFWILCP